MEIKLFDKTFEAIHKALDVSYKRHGVLSSNIANADTPNYRARELNFAGEIEKALGETKSPVKLTNPRHMDLGDSGQSHIMFDNTGAVKADGNNVDLDIAMGKLGANSRKYENAVTMLQMKLRILRMAAQGRGGA
jgi:flagellar basal-body rod protein FlgB